MYHEYGEKESKKIARIKAKKKHSKKKQNRSNDFDSCNYKLSLSNRLQFDDKLLFFLFIFFSESKNILIIFTNE